jgi:hypothetical protein
MSISGLSSVLRTSPGDRQLPVSVIAPLFLSLSSIANPGSLSMLRPYATDDLSLSDLRRHFVHNRYHDSSDKHGW